MGAAFTALARGVFAASAITMVLSMYVWMHLLHAVLPEKTAVTWSLRLFGLAVRVLFFFTPWMKVHNAPTGEQWRKMVPVDQSCLLMVNHTSQLDGFLFSLISPTSLLIKTRPLIKAGLLEIPILGPVMRMMGQLPVHFLKDEEGKFSVDKAKQAVVTERLVRHLREDAGIVFICPEGTINRYDTRQLLPFRHGSFALAIQNRLPIYGICTLGNKGFWPNDSSPGHPASIDCDIFTVHDWNDMLAKSDPACRDMSPEALSTMCRTAMQASVDRIVARGNVPESALS